MLKSDLVQLLVSQCGVTQRQAEQTIEQIFDSMTAELVKGENIEIRGFGAFHVKEYKGYKGRNPKTSATIEVRPKRGVLFRTGKELRERVNLAAAKGGAVAAPTAEEDDEDDSTESAA